MLLTTQAGIYTGSKSCRWFKMKPNPMRVRPRVIVSFAVIVALLVIGSIVLAGCTHKTPHPWTCECSSATGSMKCNGMTFSNELKGF